MTSITSYQWGDLEKTIVIGFIEGVDARYIIPVDDDNKEYKNFVAIGTETALPYDSSLEEPSPPDYAIFWVGLITSAYYRKVKVAASNDLSVNVSATEFIALIGDAKSGLRIEPILQLSFDELLSLVPPDEDDMENLNLLLSASNMDTIYTL